MSTFDQYVFKLMLHCVGTVVEENRKTFMFVYVLFVNFSFLYSLMLLVGL